MILFLFSFSQTNAVWKDPCEDATNKLFEKPNILDEVNASSPVVRLAREIQGLFRTHGHEIDSISRGEGVTDDVFKAGLGKFLKALKTFNKSLPTSHKIHKLVINRGSDTVASASSAPNTLLLHIPERVHEERLMFEISSAVLKYDIGQVFSKKTLSIERGEAIDFDGHVNTLIKLRDAFMNEKEEWFKHQDTLAKVDIIRVVRASENDGEVKYIIRPERDRQERATVTLFIPTSISGPLLPQIVNTQAVRTRANDPILRELDVESYRIPYPSHPRRRYYAY